MIDVKDLQSSCAINNRLEFNIYKNLNCKKLCGRLNRLLSVCKKIIVSSHQFIKNVLTKNRE